MATTKACVKGDHDFCARLGAEVYPRTYPNPLAPPIGPCQCACHATEAQS